MIAGSSTMRSDRVGGRDARLARFGGGPLGPIVVGGMFWVAFAWKSTFVFAGERYTSLLDDAMISMTYGRNLAHGDGLVWVAGQPPVEGYTNPLWTAILAIVHVIRVPDRFTSLVVVGVGAVCIVATILLARGLARAIVPDRRRVEIASGWLAVCFYPLAYWSLRGTEVGLLTVLLMATILMAVRQGSHSSAGGSALLAVLIVAGIATRTDFVVPAAITLAALGWWCRRDGTAVRRVVALGVAVGLALGAMSVARKGYYGDWVPNTYTLKMTGVSLATRLDRGSKLAAWTTVGFFAPALAVIALARTLVGRLPRGVGLLVAVFIGQLAYSVFVGGDAWENYHATAIYFSNRYLSIAGPALLVAAAAAVDVLWTADRPVVSAPIAVRRGVVAAVLVTLAVVPILTWRVGAGYFKDSRPHLLALFAVGLWTALGVLVLARFRPERGVLAARSAVLVVILLAIAMSGVGVTAWAVDAESYTTFEQEQARVGLALRDTAKPGTTIALDYAGAPAYFSSLPAFDILGKSDRHVATLPSHDPWYPGHSKYDYDYTVRQLLPDVVFDNLDTLDARQLADWGYESINSQGGAPYVLTARADQLDRSAFCAALARDNTFYRCDRRWT